MKHQCLAYLAPTCPFYEVLPVKQLPIVDTQPFLYRGSNGTEALCYEVDLFRVPARVRKVLIQALAHYYAVPEDEILFAVATEGLPLRISHTVGVWDSSSGQITPSGPDGAEDGGEH